MLWGLYRSNQYRTVNLLQLYTVGALKSMTLSSEPNHFSKFLKANFSIFVQICSCNHLLYFLSCHFDRKVAHYKLQFIHTNHSFTVAIESEKIGPVLTMLYTRGGQTTARGQKSARQGFFMCPPIFLENCICKTIFRNLQNLILKHTTIGTDIYLDRV